MTTGSETVAWKRSPGLLRPLHVLAGISLPLMLAVLVCSVIHGLLGLLTGSLLATAAATAVAGYFLTGSREAGCWLPAVMALFLGSWSSGFLRELLFPMKRVDGK